MGRLQAANPETEWVVVAPPFKERNGQRHFPVGDFFDLKTYQVRARRAPKASCSSIVFSPPVAAPQQHSWP